MAKRFRDTQTELAAVLEITRSAQSAQLEDYLERRADISAKAEAALLARLGIAADLPSMERWALIGLELAKAQPEFREVAHVKFKPRLRGRPRKATPTSVELADMLDGLRSDAGLERLTDAQMLAGLKVLSGMYSDPASLRDVDKMLLSTVDTRRKRVSEGRRVRRAVPKK